VRITDHFIAKHNETKTVATQQKAFLGIKNMTQPNPSPLDMARGYLATFDKYIQSDVMLDSAAFYLAKSNEKAAQLLPVKVHLLFLKEDWQGIIAAAKSMAGASIDHNDGWTPYRIGEAYMNMGDAQSALKYYEMALQRYPLHLDFLEKKGAALLALKRIAEAKKVFENVLHENPERPIALLNLGYANLLTNNLPLAEKLYDQALALDPDYEQALVNKAALLILQGEKKEAKRLLEHALVVNPESVGAREGLGRL
jgi:tetratricopeptide (TPR) repeat protein